jgi:M6 family metalloprotease-like protein
MYKFMIQRILYVALFLLTTAAAMAVPVKRGLWTTVTLADGSTVEVEAKGDEHSHYWQSADGSRYVRDASTGAFRLWNDTDAQHLKTRIRQVNRLRQQRTPSTRATATSLYTGQKKGLIILVQFNDKKFSVADPVSFYRGVANEEGFNQQGFKSSVKDYFRAQSGGIFEIDFDVVGPVTLPKNYAYYGSNDEYYAGEMVHDACVAVNDTVYFSRYDWNGDGEAEEVYVLYAGYGQADHPDNDNYIWPHMFYLSATPYYSNVTFKLDNTVIDTYACSNELTLTANYTGIGTICHEFSHCLGLLDMYDTSDGGNYGMGVWDLMDYGCYNDNGFTPCSYTGYERMFIGWSTPFELTQDTVVTNLSPVSQMGQSAIIYNPGNRNEYYILDNRQRTLYDAYLPSHGLIITHVDYDEDIWYANLVNTTGYNSDYKINNTHQRATIFHADNDDSVNSEKGDPYPYQGNDSLTARSAPATLLYNANTDGTLNLGYGLWNIKENTNGTMSFRFAVDTARVATAQGTVLLHETFDSCSGTGGNDGKFSGSVASGAFRPDFTGWSAIEAYGGDQCARFGNSRAAGTGSVTTPAFTLPGDTVTLSFRAAGWDASGDGTSLTLSLSSTKASFVQNQKSDLTLTMTKGAWTTYTVQIVGTGELTLTFSPSKRFFLDDVLLQQHAATTGIAHIPTYQPVATGDGRIYHINGQYVGTDLQALPRGIYIINGKKIVK